MREPRCHHPAGRNQPEMIGRSPAMTRLKKRLRLWRRPIERADQGRPGRKELVAKSGAWRLLATGAHPLVHSTALPCRESAAESELFGHVKGPLPAPSTIGREVRAGGQRHAVSGRDRRVVVGAAGQAAAGVAVRFAADYGDDTPLKCVDPGGHQPGSETGGGRGAVSGRPLPPAERVPIHAPALRERPGDIPCWPVTFAGAAGSAWGWSSCVSSPRRYNCSSATTGPAMCGSWSTPSTAPPCWPGPNRAAPRRPWTPLHLGPTGSSPARRHRQASPPPGHCRSRPARRHRIRSSASSSADPDGP